MASKPFQVSMTGGRRAWPSILFLGLRHSPPIDLTPAGAPGCTWYVNPILTLGAVANASGNAQLTLPMPAMIGARAWLQWINANASANALGFSFSPVGTLILGR